MTLSAPRWDMTNAYPSLESSEFKAAFEDFKRQIADLGTFFDEQIAATTPKTSAKKLAALLGDVVDRLNAVQTQAYTLGPYISCHVDTNSRDAVALKAESEFEQAYLPLRQVFVRFKGWLSKLTPSLDKIIALNPTAVAHAFIIKENADQSKYLMSEAEEALAAELSLSGGSAFGKLQGTVTSQLSVDFELDGKVEKMPMPALINLRSHPDAEVRRRGYEAENQAWESIKEVLAACMNGVKGETIALNKRRGREDALHSSLDAARIDRATLDAMMSAMEGSFPMFRKYFKSKASKLGKERLAWWDIFAPMGKTDKAYSFEEARDFIIENFGQFSPDLAAFAKRAFDNRWIDAEQRDGKRGGAYCTELQALKESRILCNFDGSFDQVGTVSHELGHAFHNECAYRAGKTVMQQVTPMTLAETASIMCETIVTEAVLKQVTDPQEELAVLESQISGAAQVIVDIYSRFLFEQEVFERRAQADLTADELNEIMERAQKATYGDGLDESQLQKFMWTWKPHYYSPALAFYNYPYAFGLLFATGLYAIYQQRGAEFVADYKNLLASTGEASAADLADRFGIDIRTRKFWDDSLSIIGRRIERYCEI